MKRAVGKLPDILDCAGVLLGVYRFFRWFTRDLYREVRVLKDT